MTPNYGEMSLMSLVDCRRYVGEGVQPESQCPDSVDCCVKNGWLTIAQGSLWLTQAGVIAYARAWNTP